MTKSPQDLAIEKTSGPCLIQAGAGTGKTFTMVKKIAHLVNNGVCKSSEILCLTFSNEATNNLKIKVQEELKQGSEITIRTFHGFSADILKELGHLIKIDPGFNILLPDDARVWMYRYLDIAPYQADLYVSTISTAKDFGISLEKIEEYTKKLRTELGCEDIEKQAEKFGLELNTLHLKSADTKEQKKDIKERKKEINIFLKAYYKYEKYNSLVDAWKKYEDLKKDKNVQDYADLTYNVFKLFSMFGAKDIANRYKYIIIDEFQDTNKQQFQMIEHLAIDHKNITVVGDTNQSIYGFRGAYRDSFNHFKEVFEINDKTDVFRLDKSYRSPNTVLRVSHKLITNNYENPEECFLVKNFEEKEGVKVKVIELKNKDEEARRIAELVDEEIEKGTPLKEICVLFRTHAQGKSLRQALEAKKIPIIAAGRTDMMQTPEIRTAISYLSILNNLVDRTGTGEQSWWQLFHYHNALIPEDLIKIGRYLKKNRDEKIAIDEAMLNKLGEIDLSSEGKKIVKRVVSRLNELVKISNKPLPDLILDIYELVGLNREFTHTRSIRNIEALMNLKQFYEIAENYYKTHDKSLSSFIDYIEILDKLGVDVEASKIQDVNAVRIMTIHTVKGLEFKTVIVSNLADKRFPLERTAKEPLIPKEFNPDVKRHLESLGELGEDETETAIKEFEKATLIYEERRLCYVAFTRAKENLILTFARSYNKEDDSTSASIFLNEIDFEKSEDISHEKDDEEKCTIFAPCSKFEQFKSLLKKQFIESLDSDEFGVLLSRLITYHAVREGKIEDYSKFKLQELFDNKELETHVKSYCDKCSTLKFDPSSFTFSPTAVLDYDECPKKYELQHIFQMPARGAFGWSGASTGSFVHQVFEDGVKAGFDKKEQFLEKAEELSKLAEWQGVDLKDVNNLIAVFWERNKGSYDSKSKVEEWVNVELEGFKFSGKVDRIDYVSDKDVEIIDYKTNKDPIYGNKRTWQLGFYALAVKSKWGLNPVRMILDMLRLEKPLVAEIQEDGSWKSANTKFTLEEIEKELVECAKKIMHDYETEFKPAEKDEPCRFCGYKFYCPKWEEDI